MYPTNNETLHRRRTETKRLGVTVLGFFQGFWMEESGQTAVEYVLFVSLLVGVISAVGKQFLAKLRDLVDRDLTPKLGRSYFQREGLYRFTFGMRR